MNFENLTHEPIEYAVVKKLAEKKLTVFLAESCTGGLIAKKLTDVFGASRVFLGGVVCYTNEIKMKLLGVKAETIELYTEVSEQAAKELAANAREIYSADIGVSVTGYASPSEGLSPELVGTVFVGISIGDITEVIRLKLSGDRTQNREAAAQTALELICKYAN